MWTKIRQTLGWVLCFAGLLAGGAQAKDAPVYTSLFSKVAVGGYDTVAYFTAQMPVKGDSRFTSSYMGVEWRFSSAENRDKFMASPERYAPQYGGYCAWAVAEGSTASGDPLRWKIVSNKLYLNYDADVQKKWELNIPEHIKNADKNWPAVLGK
jgi:YHS domain-containing protein